MELDYTVLLVPFLMGLFSSMHCLGMCGSIIGTLTLSLKPEIRTNKARLFPFVLNYNLGRITSYTIAGLLVGSARTLLITPFDVETGYRVLQIFSAIIMTGAGLYIAGWLPKFAYIEKIGFHIWKFLEPFGRKLIPVETGYQAFLFGMVWGWLPCGLVYSALALALTAGSISNSSLTMLAFGIGTLPAVMTVGIMASLFARFSSMQKTRQLIGVLMIALAVFATFPWLYPRRVH